MKKLLILLIGLFLIACHKDNSDDPVPAIPEPHTIQYDVTCKDCDVIYIDKDGIERRIGVLLSWQYEYEGKSGQYVMINASSNHAGHYVDGKIYYNKKIFKQKNSVDGIFIEGNIP
jgi:hypothetical protein